MTDQQYARLPHEELIEQLFNQEDLLPKRVIDEVISRGQEIIPLLAEIVMDRTVWVAELPDWWAPVHATYALGAIGGEEVVMPLLAALRWSDAYDNEWITEDLPSIFGTLGEISLKPLLSTIWEKSAGWSARSIAMDGLGALALRAPHLEEEIMRQLHKILRDPSDEYGARRSAAYVLLDFRRAECREDLLALAELEMQRQQKYPDYPPAFTPEEVHRDLHAPRMGMDVYMHDWMEFYARTEIHKRRERWVNAKGEYHPESFDRSHAASRGAIQIERNDPCPCGSGKPFKRCCWNKLH